MELRYNTTTGAGQHCKTVVSSFTSRTQISCVSFVDKRFGYEIIVLLWTHQLLGIDLIHDARHLCTRLTTDGIKAMLRGFSGGKQVINFSNTRNQGLEFGGCLFLTTENAQVFIFNTIMAN